MSFSNHKIGETVSKRFLADIRYGCQALQTAIRIPIDPETLEHEFYIWGYSLQP